MVFGKKKKEELPLPPPVENIPETATMEAGMTTQTTEEVKQPAVPVAPPVNVAQPTPQPVVQPAAPVILTPEEAALSIASLQRDENIELYLRAIDGEKKLDLLNKLISSAGGQQ